MCLYKIKSNSFATKPMDEIVTVVSLILLQSLLVCISCQEIYLFLMDNYKVFNNKIQLYCSGKNWFLMKKENPGVR